MEILAGIPDGSTADQVKYFNSWLTSHNDFSTSADSGAPQAAHSCLSALLGSTGAQGPVCEGYAKAFQLLCDRAGIPCILAVKMEKTGNHAWNYVKIGQLWYAVDVTWNDPVVMNQDGSRNVQAVSGYENETYLLAGSETRNGKGESFLESHDMQDDQPGHYLSSSSRQIEWSKHAYKE